MIGIAFHAGDPVLPREQQQSTEGFGGVPLTSCRRDEAVADRDTARLVGGCVKAHAADHPTVLAATDLVGAERPGVPRVRTSSQEAFGGGHVAVGGVSRRPAVTAARLARHYSLGLADGHRMKHEPRCHKIAHSREEYHEG